MAVATTRIFGPEEGATASRRLLAAPGDTVPDGYSPDGTWIGVGVQPTAVPYTEPDAAVPAAPWDGYDDMPEEAILDLLPGLTPGELDAVRRYERAHLARGAIHRYGEGSNVVTSRGTRRIEAESTSVAPGYGAMTKTALSEAAMDRALTVPADATKAQLVALLQADDANKENQ